MQEKIPLKYDTLISIEEVMAKNPDPLIIDYIKELHSLILYQRTLIKDQRADIVATKHKSAWTHYSTKEHPQYFYLHKTLLTQPNTHFLKNRTILKMDEFNTSFIKNLAFIGLVTVSSMIIVRYILLTYLSPQVETIIYTLQNFQIVPNRGYIILFYSYFQLIFTHYRLLLNAVVNYGFIQDKSGSL